MIKIYVGKSASGKDTFLRKAVLCGFKPIVTYTTRPIRTGEKDGVDYHFVNKIEFDYLVRKGFLWETRSYRTTFNGKPDEWYYGSPLLEDIETAEYVTILDVQGAQAYIRQYGKENIEIVLVEVDDNIRKERAVKRGTFSEDEWERRCKDDNIKFSEDALKALQEKLGKPIVVINNNGNKPLFGSLQEE